MGRLQNGTAPRFVAVTMLVLGLWLTAIASVASAGEDGEGASPLGQTLMTAAKASGVLDAIEGSLVYLGAKYDGASTAKKVAAESTAPGSVYSGEGSTYKPGDPLPPASAGTNGTPIPPPPGSGGEPFVARIPPTPNKS